MDMIILDTTKSISDGFIYQVISSSDSKLYYLIIRDRITTYLCIMCRYRQDLYKPRVKMRGSDKMYTRIHVMLYMHTCIVFGGVREQAAAIRSTRSCMHVGPILPCACNTLKRAGYATWWSGHVLIDACRPSLVDAFGPWASSCRTCLGPTLKQVRRAAVKRPSGRQ